MNFRLLGECVDSDCDLGGTDRCTAFVDEGGARPRSLQCRSASSAMGRSAADTF
jgi:hypothetical protein